MFFKSTINDRERNQFSKNEAEVLATRVATTALDGEQRLVWRHVTNFNARPVVLPITSFLSSLLLTESFELTSRIMMKGRLLLKIPKRQLSDDDNARKVTCIIIIIIIIIINVLEISNETLLRKLK